MFFTVLSYAQVGVNNAAPDPSATLDVTSTTGGLLVPRVTKVQRNDIKNAVLGLMIFCIDCASGEGELQINYASGWKNAADAIAPVITVNAGTDTVEQGSTWTDAGATSDGGEEVTAQGTVDVNIVDIYTITYTATDAAGNVGTATRSVTVEPVADFKIGDESNYNTETNIITIQLSNIGDKKSTGVIFHTETITSDFRRIFEVTTNINDSKRIGNLQAGTPLYVTKNDESITYYPKSQPNFTTNSIIDIDITSNNNTSYSATSTNTQPVITNDVSPLYIRTTPTQDPGVIQTISFKITDDFEPEKTYIFCADDVAYNSNGNGDTVEIIDDLDNPSNNYFVWTVRPDTTEPVITVNAGTDTVDQGSTWIDAGATSDGGEEVTAQGTVDVNIVDIYTITYTAIDAAGNVGTATRLVTVEPVADFEIGNESIYNTETNIITIQLSNIGSKKSTGAPFQGAEVDFRRIFEVTTNINDSERIGNLQAGTPLYVTKNGESTTYYPKSQPDFDTNSIIDIEITSDSDTSYSAAISTNVAPVTSGDENPLYITTTPTQDSGDIQTISFKITDDFEPGKTYIFCADDVAWNLDGKGDTVEIIDDLDNPSNNYFVWTVPNLTIPVILIKWDNLDFESSQLSFNGNFRSGTFDDVNDLYNSEEDYNYPKNAPEDPYSGSVVDYYKAISHGRMSPNFEIINASSNETPTSLDDYAHTISGNYAEYGEKNDSNGNRLKPELLAAYNQAVENYGIDNFNKLYGKKHVIFMHSGYGAETHVDNKLDYIWSHKWNFINDDNETIKYFTYPYKKENNNITNIIPIGVIVHESLHMFGLPDFYDTDFSSKGAGYLSVMASGSWGVNSQSPWLPAFATPYTRSKLSRFFTANLIDINGTETNLSLPPISRTDKTYKLTIPDNPNEYWLLENKKEEGFDRNLNDEGIIIWHVVESVANNRNEYSSNDRGESGYKMSLEASDGLFNLERKKSNHTTRGRLWKPGQEFSPYSSPSTVMQNGNSTGIKVYNIRESGDDMLFDVEYITEPEAKINTVTLDNKLLTITTTGLVNENLEIGFNNNDYVQFNVTSNEMTIDLSVGEYNTKFTDNIQVNKNSPYNGFNTLNIRAAANSFTDNRSERPFSYNYTFEFTELGKTSQIRTGAKIINQNEDKLIKFKY